MKMAIKIQSKLYGLAMVVLVLIPLNIPAVGTAALTPDDIQSIIETTPYYDPTGKAIAGGTENCGISSVTPGSGAPDGAQFPNLDASAMASAIDKWILKENPNSKLKGLGSTIVASSKNSNVNPFLIVAIAKKESSLSNPSDFNVSHGNNSFGRTATESQPNFVGARLWYKWSSVKASVDYTAPENQNAEGGGDMATYLRVQYGSQIDHDNLTALFLLYAPPSENDTAKYIAEVQGWINELIALTGAQPVGATNTQVSIDCSGVVIGDAVKTALGYAWPDHHPPNYCKEKPSYKAAMEKASSNGEFTGGTCMIDGTWLGVDCGAFVTRVMRDSKVDPNYNSANGTTVAQQQYLDNHPELYQKLTNVNSTADLQPGDIAINSVHTYIYVGSQPGFNGNSASASFSSDDTSWRAPMADSAYFSNSAGPFTWYRLKAGGQIAP